MEQVISFVVGLACIILLVLTTIQELLEEVSSVLSEGVLESP